MNKQNATNCSSYKVKCIIITNNQNTGVPSIAPFLSRNSVKQRRQRNQNMTNFHLIISFNCSISQMISSSIDQLKQMGNNIKNIKCNNTLIFYFFFFFLNRTTVILLRKNTNMVIWVCQKWLVNFKNLIQKSIICTILTLWSPSSGLICDPFFWLSKNYDHQNVDNMQQIGKALKH